MSTFQEEKSIVYDKMEDNYEKNADKTISEVYFDSVVIANNKAHSLEPWEVIPSTYFIDKFLIKDESLSKERVAIFNFTVEGKSYIEKHLVFDQSMELIIDDFSKNSNKQNIFKYSDSKLSKQLFDIFIDYVNENKNISFNSRVEEFVSAEELKFDILSVNQVQAKFSSRLKNFERDLLINKYPDQKDDIDNQDLRDIIFATSQVLYVTSNKYLFILTYTPTNEQYYNDQIQESSKAPSFSILIYERDVEEQFVENYEKINLLHSNFMQFVYASDISQNVANAMGESSLISQHWYTTGVERILNGHKAELKKSKTSKLLSELIVKYILAADIEGVNLIEVYPFDRVFLFDEAIDFSSQSSQDSLTFDTAEGLIESKITNKYINDKEFLGGKTRYAYEWERLKAKLPLEKFNPSRKKLNFISTSMDKLKQASKNYRWIEPYDKDIDTVINNLISTFRISDVEKDNTLLEYQSKYVNNNILYLYTTGVDLIHQMPALYSLQKEYLEGIEEDNKTGIKKFNFESIYGEENPDFNFNNAKVVLFSYLPEEEDDKSKGFTMILLANEDVQKAAMEQKAERDDLHTALKLLVNQHFTIDAEYKKTAEKEQKELVDILSQTQHSLKNSFDEFINDENNYNVNALLEFKSKVLSLLEQDRKQMEDYGRDAQEITIDYSAENTLNNSLNIIKRMMSSSSSSSDTDSKEGALLNRKFVPNSIVKPWDAFANALFNIEISDLKNNRIQQFEWKSQDKPQKTLILKVDFNEIQDFKVEWKESLFNDAIYVMLKNSCEHSIETMKESGMKREIFLDLYISNHNDQDCLNLEFTNHTTKICKQMFEHINKGTDQRDNKNKENSTGIGVVTIRKRLDVTYGLDRSNIKFTMVGSNKIKSRLYIPVESLIEDESVFIDEQDCNKNTNILYLEDEYKYYNSNLKILKEHGIECDHYQGMSDDISFEEYDVLLTDLNILGEGSGTNVASASNGEAAIYEFTKQNPRGTIIILSSDELSTELNGYTIDEDVVHFDRLSQSTVYVPHREEIKELKIIQDFMINPLLEKYESHSRTESSLENKHKDSNKIKKQAPLEDVEYTFSKIIHGIDGLSTEVANSLSDVHRCVYIVQSDDIKPLVDKWTNCHVQRKRGGPITLANSEVPHQFFTRLVIKTDLSENYYLPALLHESLRRNIIFVPVDVSEEEILKLVNNSMKYIFPKKGVLRQLDHDIISKMSEFGNYSQKDIDNLHNHKNSLVKLFDDIFIAFCENQECIQLNILENEVIAFIEEIKKLEKNALKKGNNLGSSFSKLQKHIILFDYLLSGVK